MRRKWTQSELDFMMNKYSNMPTAAIAKSLDRSYSSVCGMAYILGLNKSAEYFDTDGGGRMKKGSKLGVSGRFTPGHVPANKGVKMSDDVKAKVQHTFFKPGMTPHNAKYDGYESVRVSKGRKYTWIRIQGKYVLKHRHIWEQHCGPIPAGCNVQFSDGDTMNLKPENLYLIDRHKQMLVNSIHNYPDNIAELIRLKAKLKKKIKKLNHATKQN